MRYPEDEAPTKAKTMKRKIVSLLAGILWSSAVIALLFMFSVCRLMTDDIHWFFALGLKSEELSSEEYVDIIERDLSVTVAECIDGHGIESNRDLLTDTDTEWLNTRKQHVSVMRKTSLGLGIGCLAVLVCWIVQYCRIQGKVNVTNRKGRYKSYLFVLFVIWLFSGSLLALTLSIVAFCWIRANKGSLIPHDDAYSWIGAGCFCTVVIYRVAATLILDLHVIQPIHVFSSWLPINGGMLQKLITPSSIRYMENELALPYDLRVRDAFLAISAIFLVSGLIMTWLGKRKAKAAFLAKQAQR